MVSSLLPLVLLSSAVCNAYVTNNTNTTSNDDSNIYNVTESFYPTIQGGRLHDDAWAVAYDRARKIVDDLTIAEKVNLTTGVGIYGGSQCSGNTGSVPRLNISSICLQDGPLGIRSTDLATVFPCGLATSATFNKKLIYDRSVAIASEFKGKGADVLLGPVYGPIGVKAQGGRGWEGHGPDPYLEGVTAYLSTLGVQSQGVVSCAKHLVANEQEYYRFPLVDRPTGPKNAAQYNNTHAISSEIDDRALHELYVWPFAEATRAGVGAIMCSYNRLNGTQSCQNSHLLNHILKEELGFQGFVTSDWFALYSGVDAAIAGLDMDMPGDTTHFGGNLTVAALNGSLPLDRLDDMATRILASLYYTHTYNPEGPNYHASTTDTYGYEFFTQKEGPIVQLNKHVDVRSEFSRAISLKTATEAVILLKNVNETLPLKRTKDRRITILGQAAGNDKEGTTCALRGCGDGAVGAGYGSGTGTYTYFVTPADGIGARAIEEGVSYEYIRESWNLNSAYTSASKADAAIIVANSIAGEEVGGIVDPNNSTYSEFGDLNNLTLWHNAETLIKNITSVNNNTILVLTTAQQVDLEPFIDNENITAVIFSSYLGQDYGTAIAKILFGDENPSGKLPFTIAKDVEEYIPLVKDRVDYPQDKLYQHSIFVDYKYFDKYEKEVRYEFGYGLSYSNFTLSDLEVIELKELTEEIEDELITYKDVYNFTESSLDPEDYVYPEDFEPISNRTYSFLNDASEVVVDNSSYPYPKGYSTEQPSKPSSKAAGGLGGNPRLWDVAYIVNAKVTNEGPYDGSFAPQLYVAFPDSDEFPTPPVQLRGFEKVQLQDGYSQTVSFEVTRKDLSVWDTKSQSWIVLRGDYKFYVASTSRELELVETVTLN